MSSPTAVMVTGEDRESDGEEPTRASKEPQGVAVPGEAPESDEDDADTASVSSVGSVVQSPSTEPSNSSSRNQRRQSSSSTHHSSLLHRKLRERNMALHRSMTDLVKQALSENERELQTVTQGLGRTHLQLQETLQVFRSLTGDLLRVQARMDDFYDCQLLPEIDFSFIDSTKGAVGGSSIVP